MEKINLKLHKNIYVCTFEMPVFLKDNMEDVWDIIEIYNLGISNDEIFEKFITHIEKSLKLVKGKRLEGRIEEVLFSDDVSRNIFNISYPEYNQALKCQNLICGSIPFSSKKRYYLPTFYFKDTPITLDIIISTFKDKDYIHCEFDCKELEIKVKNIPSQKKEVQEEPKKDKKREVIRDISDQVTIICAPKEYAEEQLKAVAQRKEKEKKNSGSSRVSNKGNNKKLSLLFMDEKKNCTKIKKYNIKETAQRREEEEKNSEGCSRVSDNSKKISLLPMDEKKICARIKKYNIRAVEHEKLSKIFGKGFYTLNGYVSLKVVCQALGIKHQTIIKKLKGTGLIKKEKVLCADHIRAHIRKAWAIELSESKINSFIKVLYEILGINERQRVKISEEIKEVIIKLRDAIIFSEDNKKKIEARKIA